MTQSTEAAPARAASPWSAWAHAIAAAATAPAPTGLSSARVIKIRTPGVAFRRGLQSGSTYQQ